MTKNEALKKVKKDGLFLEFLDPIMQNDDDILYAAIKNNITALKIINQPLNIKIFDLLTSDINSLVKKDMFANYTDKFFYDNINVLLTNISEHVNKEEIIKSIPACKYIETNNLIDIPLIIKTIFSNYLLTETKEKVIDLLKKMSNSECNNIIENRFNNDKDFIIEAIKSHGSVINKSFITQFSEDKDFMLKVAKVNKFLFALASPKLLDDHDFMLNALKLNGKVMEYLSPRLAQVEELVLEGVKNGGILQFDSGNSLNLADNRKIILEAVKKHVTTLMFVTDRLKDDEEVVTGALENDGIAYAYISDRLKKKENLIRMTLNTKPYMIGDVCMALNNDIEARKWAYFTLSIDGKSIEHMFQFQDDADIVNTALENDIEAFYYIENHSLIRPDLLLNVAVNKKELLTYANCKFTKEVWEHCYQTRNKYDSIYDDIENSLYKNEILENITIKQVINSQHIKEAYEHMKRIEDKHELLNIVPQSNNISSKKKKI